MSESTDILLVEDDPGDVHLALAVFRSLQIHAERYAALALFWGWANEPPPGCLLQPRSRRRMP